VRMVTMVGPQALVVGLAHLVQVPAVVEAGRRRGLAGMI